MKKILFIITLFITSFSFGQIIIPKYLRHILAQPASNKPSISAEVNCTTVSLNGCNYINNPGFVPSQFYYNNVNTYYAVPFDIDGT